MRHRSKILLGAITAALVLATAINTANARRLEISNTGFRVVWSEAEPLQFEAIANIRCSITMEGTFHSRTLSKVSGQLVGFITSAAVHRPCAGGEAWVQNGTENVPGDGMVTSLPWHIRYDSFAGTLPRIGRIRLQLVGAGFLVRALGVGCLVVTEARHPAFGFVELNETTGVVTGLSADPGPTIPTLIRLEGITNCPAGKFSGRGSVTLLGNTTPITVRLVQ